MICSSPQLPSSFDPALHLHSELALPDAPGPSYSDDLEALQLQVKETTAAKTREGIVIQHRAWNLRDIFRSEEDRLIDTPLKRPEVFQTLPDLIHSDSSLTTLPSSPPTTAMPLISSPVAYPATSSPAIESPRKRRKLGEIRSPLGKIDVNNAPKMVGGFMMADSDDDDDDDDEDFATIKATNNRKRLLAELKDLPPPEEHLLTSNTISDVANQPLDDSEALQEVEPDEPISLPTQLPETLPSNSRKPTTIRTASGRIYYVGERRHQPVIPYEQLIASRSTAAPGRARKSYYGINIHQLLDDASREIVEAAETAKKIVAEIPKQSVEEPVKQAADSKNGRTLMWTEKYRAKRFMDLVGDERTHRSVLRWLKAWDPIVFPGSGKHKQKAQKNGFDSNEDQRHRKILMLTGPPGLGKTTLAHVCARQAGYEVQEINASDERSRDVVKGRIRDMVGTENVKGVDTKTENGKVRKAGRPVCVVVDEVDGVVSGSGGGGEGGFIKALIDLVNLDQKNSSVTQNITSTTKRKKKGDNFRLLRPMILICNDVYHPSLRPLRQSSIAEIIHIRKPPLNMVVSRMHSIFQKEGIPCDTDGVRRLCEATWGVSNRKEGGTGTGTGEGDIRGVMVVGEWVAGRLRATMDSSAPGITRLTRRWVEEQLLNDLSHGGGAARSLGRGGAKEVVERVFQEGAGFPKTGTTVLQSDRSGLEASGVIGVAEGSKRRAMERLREMVDTSGDCDRIVTECFTSYPTQPFQDDTFLSKPNSAYDWLAFHDSLSTSVHGGQEWELYPYLSSSVLAFHHLFASSFRPSYTSTNANLNTNTANSNDAGKEATHPFSGSPAPFAAAELQKQNRAALAALKESLSLPLMRMFRSMDEIATELLPYVLRMLAPDIKPVIVNMSAGPGDKSRSSTASVRRASERALVARAVNAMAATGVRFERNRVEFDASGPPGRTNGGWVYRMEPALDALGVFETMNGKRDDKVRFAVRQVLEAEWKRENARREAEAAKRRGGGEIAEADEDGEKRVEENVKELVEKEEKKGKGVKRDFFGRILEEPALTPGSADGKDMSDGTAAKKQKKGTQQGEEERRVWVSFHEGFSNAVRKPVTLKELMSGL